MRSEVFGELVALIAAGKLHAKVAATYGIDAIKDAVTAAATAGRSGKILLLPNGEIAE